MSLKFPSHCYLLSFYTACNSIPRYTVSWNIIESSDTWIWSMSNNHFSFFVMRSMSDGFGGKNLVMSIIPVTFLETHRVCTLNIRTGHSHMDWNTCGHTGHKHKIKTHDNKHIRLTQNTRGLRTKHTRIQTKLKHVMLGLGVKMFWVGPKYVQKMQRCCILTR